MVHFLNKCRSQGSDQSLKQEYHKIILRYVKLKESKSDLSKSKLDLTVAQRQQTKVFVEKNIS